VLYKATSSSPGPVQNTVIKLLVSSPPGIHTTLRTSTTRTMSVLAPTLALVTSTTTCRLLSRRTRDSLDITLGAVRAAALSGWTRTLLGIGTALTGGLASARRNGDVDAVVGGSLLCGSRCLLGRRFGVLSHALSSCLGATGILLLQFGKTLRFVVDIHHLSGGLGVKVDKLLTGRCVGGFLIVAHHGVEQTRRHTRSLLGDAVGLIHALGLIGRVVLLIDLLESREEAVRHTVLLVQLDGALGRRIGNDVAVGEVLCDDARARLFLLGDLVGVTVIVGGVVVVIRVIALVGGRDGDLVGAQLGVIEEQSGLGCGRLLEGYDGFLACRAGLLDLDGGDFAAEAEELFDLLLRGGGGDVLDVDGVWRGHLDVSFECNVWVSEDLSRWLSYDAITFVKVVMFVVCGEIEVCVVSLFL
jgi:hypothetical protein